MSDEIGQEIAKADLLFLALQYSSSANDYLEAGRLVHRMNSNRILFAPTYQMFAHAIELYLKAFLLYKGTPYKELTSREVRHDLLRLLRKALGSGLALTIEHRGTIRHLAKAHRSHFFRYYEHANMSAPSVERILKTVEALQHSAGLLPSLQLLASSQEQDLDS